MSTTPPSDVTVAPRVAVLVAIAVAVGEATDGDIPAMVIVVADEDIVV